MPNNTLEKWEEKILEDILDKGSSNLSANKLDNCDGEYPVYGASGLVKKVNFYQQDKEYLAIIKDGAGVGRVYHYEPKSSVLGTLQYLFPKENINIRFAYYYLLSLNFKKYYQGAAIPHIYYKDYKNEKLVLPPLSEQQRFVGILDEAFENIEKAKQNTLQNLNNAKELFECTIDNLLFNNNNGSKYKLKDVCEYVKVQGKYNLPYVGMEHIKGASAEFIGCYDNATVKSTTFHFKKGMVLYGRLRPYLRKVLLATFEGHCSTEIFPILPNELIDKEFLLYWLLSQRITNKIDATWTGARMPRANMNQVLEFEIKLPDIAEQRFIAQKIRDVHEKTKKLEQIYTKKLQDLDELKQSILQKAFNGEL